MNWRRYRALRGDQKKNEAYYILGIDIGNDSSGIAFYNMADKTPETVDLSGGYGKPTIPTMAQYIPETKEWVIGEYALMNRGAGGEITIDSLMSRLGEHEYIDVAGRPVSIVTILSTFIRELIGNIKNINPKAEIVGIAASIPSYFTERAREEYEWAFKAAGYEKELIALIPDRECVFRQYFNDSEPRDETLLLVDCGSREARGGMYRLEPSDGLVRIKSISSRFETNLGTAAINEDVRSLFYSFYRTGAGAEPGERDAEHLYGFTHQHKDALFQKNIKVKPVKLYFNFVYPPFQTTVTFEQSELLVSPYRKSLERFIRGLTETNSGGGKNPEPPGIDAALCVGGGFEMLWVRETLTSMFGNERVRFYRNSKSVAAEGAATAAAVILGASDGPKIEIEDRHQLLHDIGMLSSDGAFLPLIERNAFWWQSHTKKYFIVNNPVEDKMTLTLATRSRSEEISEIADLIFDSLPARPKGCAVMSVSVDFKSDSEFTTTFQDEGFGEIAPRTDYRREFAVRHPDQAERD